MKTKFKIIFIFVAVFVVFSWIIAASFWNSLPSIIPIHFGINGMADGWAEKSFLQVFMIPILQLLIAGLFVFVYFKPQYSNIPGTMWLTTLDKRHKAVAYDLIRTMNAGISLIISVMFTYITGRMNISALNPGQGLSTGFMIIILGLIIAWSVFWSVKVYRINKRIIVQVGAKKK